MRTDPLQVFGLGWAGLFDHDGNGPTSARWIVYRLLIDGKLSSVAFSRHGGDLFTFSGDSARELATALLAALDLTQEPPHDGRELSEGGPDRYDIRGADGAETRSVTGFRIGASLAARRGPGSLYWSLDHVPTGFSVMSFASYGESKVAAETLNALADSGAFDLSSADRDAIVSQPALADAVRALKGRVRFNHQGFPFHADDEPQKGGG